MRAYLCVPVYFLADYSTEQFNSRILVPYSMSGLTFYKTQVEIENKSVYGTLKIICELFITLVV